MKTRLAILCTLLFASAAMAGSVTVTVKPEVEKKSTDLVKEEYVTAHWLRVRITNYTGTKLEGVTLKWALYAANLRRGADTLAVEKSGEMTVSVDSSGRYVDIETPKVAFDYVRTHSERSGRRSYKLVEESGKKYHGFHVQVLSGSQVLGEAVSESVRKHLK
ncbi:hypothetical protein [Prosthecobacter sp.]|uniref:hypothetical protein n=1 Tax=Prosthecobacter sp. TaxID=1965333 RepID=UPI003783CF64